MTLTDIYHLPQGALVQFPLGHLLALRTPRCMEIVLTSCSSTTGGVIFYGIRATRTGDPMDSVKTGEHWREAAVFIAHGRFSEIRRLA